MPITQVTPNTLTRGQHYPWFDRISDKWALVAIPYEKDAQKVILNPYQQFGWARSNGYRQLLIPSESQSYNMTTMQAFAREKLGMELRPDRKGPFVMAKRFSRIVGPHRAFAFMPRHELTVTHPELDEWGEKVWDGFGLVSRSFIERFVERIPTCERAWYRREMDCGRWEFTIQTAAGQLKGHAMVSDDIEADFHVPNDCKTELTLIDETECFVAVRPVHGRGDMHLDIQSLVNLYPFFQPEQLLAWLKEEGDAHLTKLERGELDRSLKQAEVDEERYWHVPDFLQRGGESQWFASIRRSMGFAHINRLRTRQGKLRLPIPGGRYYIAPAVAGLAEVERGSCLIDAARGTLWVNPHDWYDYIASRTGGADHDDAYWTYVFTDQHGETRVLAWRSPNQNGEYILLRPAAGSDIPQWHGEVQLQQHNTEALPTVIEDQKIIYLDLIDPDEMPDTDPVYTAEVVKEAVERAYHNRGVLGRMCNRLMIMKAMGTLDQDDVVLPANLEDIIDADVKTGVDMSLIKADCEEWERWMETSGCVSDTLIERISSQPRIERIWMDDLALAVGKYIVDFKERLNAACLTVRPPTRLLALGAEHTAIGAEFVRHYTYACETYEHLYQPGEPVYYENTDGVYVDNFFGDVDDLPVVAAVEQVEHADNIIYSEPLNKYDYAYQQCRRFMEGREEQVILGAIHHVYTADPTQTMDAAIWLSGPQRYDLDGQPFFARGINQQTIEVLTKHNILFHRSQDGQTYQTAEREIETERTSQRIVLNNVWFNYGLALKRVGTAALPSQVEPEIRSALKREVATLSEQMTGQIVTVKAVNDTRQAAYGKRGNIIGYVSRFTELAQGEYTVEMCRCNDGDWTLIVK